MKQQAFFLYSLNLIIFISSTQFLVWGNTPDQGSALRFQSQIFGIKIGIGIDFSDFLDWDWDRFFKILGLGSESRIQDKIPRTLRNPKKSQRWWNKPYGIWFKFWDWDWFLTPSGLGLNSKIFGIGTGIGTYFFSTWDEDWDCDSFGDLCP